MCELKKQHIIDIIATLVYYEHRNRRRLKKMIFFGSKRVLREATLSVSKREVPK
jgi:hypothetical protein